MHLAPLLALLCVAGCDDADETYEMRLLIEHTGRDHRFVQSGALDVPVGTFERGRPLGPGDAYEVTFTAAPGARLSFATMFMPSNDWFYAPAPEGIALYDEGGAPISGEVTGEVLLWDAGTEHDQPLGAGADQVAEQQGPGVGAPDPDARVRRVVDASAPATEDVIRVWLDAGAERSFTLLIENVSDATTLTVPGASTGPVPLSPGVFVVHHEPAPLFTEGAPDRGAGLEALAEDGRPVALAEVLAVDTGYDVPFSPGVLVVHAGHAPLFTANQPASGALESLAEDGSPESLGGLLLQSPDAFFATIFDRGAQTDARGPIGPGESFMIEFPARPGDRLSFAMMLGASNDLFYAPDPAGIALFESEDQPRIGDVTDEVLLWDAGTERNEEPGIGESTAPHQPAPNMGPVENAPVRLITAVADPYWYPGVRDVMRVTVGRVR